MLVARIIVIAIYALVFCAVLFLLNRLSKKYTWKKEKVGDFFFFFAFATAVLQKDAPYFSFDTLEIVFAIAGTAAYLLGTLGIVKLELNKTILIILSLGLFGLSLFYGTEIFLAMVLIAAIIGALLSQGLKFAQFIGVGASLLLAFILIFIALNLVKTVLELS
jgi:hypothetical protein